MRQHPIEQAINEQARGFVAEEGLDNGVKHKRLTKQQIFRARRPIEAIMIDMADKMKNVKKPDQGKQKKRRKRRRRRGPKVLAVNYFDQIK
jgi:hypothetical protein